jgi:dihydroxyacid dehydratase/phosphogluconate dehydratase
LIDAIQADVVICDHFSEGCLDAAISKDIPLVLTSTLAMYPGKKKRRHIMKTQD